MSFARTYLKRYSSGLKEDLPPPNPDLFFTLVIPVYREPDLLYCLKSLNEANPVKSTFEVLLVINHSDADGDDIVSINKQTEREVKEFSKRQGVENKVFILSPAALPAAKAGAGLARKIGMDTALDRFDLLNRPDGVIISLDADTLIGKDFFVELEQFYLNEPKAQAATCYFEHLRVFAKKQVTNIEAMVQYEIYLRTVKLALQWTGYPLAFHTLGSAFSVRASAYVKAGGMGVQKAGEDFYFLHKCAQLGNFWENNKVIVYPSGRESDRVLFGTGPFIRDYQQEYPNGYQKYSWKAFQDLRKVVHIISSIDYSWPKSNILEAFEELNDQIVQELLWSEKIVQAHEQSSDTQSFRKWTWRLIDGLQIVKYLNSHQRLYGSSLVRETAGELLNSNGYKGCTMQSLIVLKELKNLDRSDELRRVY